MLIWTGTGRARRRRAALTIGTGAVALLTAALALAATGDLTPLGCIKDAQIPRGPCAGLVRGLGGPHGVAVSPDGLSTYVVSATDDAIVTFRRDSTGPLAPLGCIDDNDVATDPTQGEDQCARSTDGLDTPTAVAVSPDGTSVYVLAADDAAIVRFSRDANGNLTPRGCVDDTLGPDACARSTPGLVDPEGLAISPDGRSVYVTSVGSDAVVRFARNLDTGALNPRGCIGDDDNNPASCAATSPALNAPRGIAVSPDGRSVYTVSSLSENAVVHFARNETTGGLFPRGCVEDAEVGLDSCAQETPGLRGATDVAVTPDGAFVYAVATGDDAVVRLTRDEATGALAPATCVEDDDTGESGCASATDGLDAPRSLALSPDGESVYVAGGGDSAVVRLSHDAFNSLLDPSCIEDAVAAPDNCRAGDADGLARPGDLALSPEGDSLYVAGTRYVVQFAREPATP